MSIEAMKQALEGDSLYVITGCIEDIDKCIVHRSVLVKAIAKQENAETCPDKERTEYVCKNRQQCWEPCGDLGKSEEHVRVASTEDIDYTGLALLLKIKHGIK